MAQQNNIAQQLNDLLVTRNFHPDMLDAQGKVSDSEDAKTFTFNYISGAGKNYGTMVVILDSDNDLKAFYGDNLGRSMEGDDKDEFFDFQQHLSQFANAHRYTYTAKDLGQLKHTMQGLAAITEGLFEGYYGTRRISYAGKPTEARLMIRHNRNLGENDARFRYVESIFVETAEGERYRLPFTNLAGGRAMLEHVRQGGKPYDVRGNHICEMITELKVLTRFNRASQGRVLEGIKQGVVEGAQTYYKTLRESIKRMASPRGYTAYFESWHPANITEQDQLVEDIKTLFVEQTIDDRIEQALPLLAKIQRGREMKEADIFENWMNTLAEGTWSLPETPEQLNKLKELMSGELIVGPDGTNAKEQLYDLIGDDLLFDRIGELAAQDPRANLWDDSIVQARMQELGIQMPDRAEPDMDAQPDQGVAEEFVDQSPDETMDDPDQDDRIANFQKIGQPMDARVGGQRTTTGPDYQERTASVTGPDSRGMHKVTVTRNDDIASNYLTKNPPNNSRFFVSKDTNEADNIAAFESLQRMRHLSGMPLKENVLNDSGSTLDYIIKTYQRDVKDFMQNNGDMSEPLYDALYDYYQDDMPYGVKKARTGDPYEWVGQRFYDDLQGSDMVDENLGGIVGEAGAGAGQGNRGKLPGARAYPVRTPNIVQTGQIPSAKITAMALPDPIAMTAINRAPVKGLDLTQGRPGRLDDTPLPELPMATLPNRAPVKGLDLTQGRPGRLDDTPLPELPMATLPNRAPVKGLDLTLPMAAVNRAPVKGLDLTQGRPGRLDDYEQQLEEGCNYTMENQYCPMHGLKECWLEEMNQSILDSGSRLIEDLDEDYGPPGSPGGKVRAMGTNVFKRGPKSTGAYDTEAGYFARPEDRDATRSQADNDRAKRIRDWEKMTGQDDVSPEYNNQFRPIPPRTPTPRTSTAVAKPVPSAKITATDLPDEVDDQGRQYFQNYVIDTDGKQIPRIRVDGVGRTHDDSMDEGRPGLGAAARGASELGGKAVNAVKDMITKIPPGHPDYPLLQAARNQEQGNMKVWNKRDPKPFPWNPASDTDLVKDFNHDLNVRKGFGQFQRDAMPNDSAPTGYIRAQKSKGAAIDAENSMQGNQDLFKRAYGIDEDMTDVGDVVGQAARSVTDRLGQAASDMYEPIGNFFKGVKQGYNGKAQTATAARPDAPDQSDAETARLGRAGASADSEFVQSPDEAGRSLNYESREGDALLARIKSLALLR